ncbi:diguanylate cyclase [Paenibacillus sp. NFR01]|uniref:diguanylate cyclase domain-containing protein n=1 Tax=Paenibacillus sp. NFR01 TaxID=1566279 RepID=UPI0008BE3B93|nr:diguanylate cyclase [Paenibacillus sp. NFR01]SES95306.1 diguanylate cyclase (GGDEF) domain-containing protein [Paenibacillus sp. NFR01]
MRISEFAAKNQVTVKMLRHYDELGLLKPSAVDPFTGYRSYEEQQSGLLNWIMLLKSLEFSLAEVKDLLDRPISSEELIHTLRRKRIVISGNLNVQLQRKVQIDRLIRMLEEDEFRMERLAELSKLEKADVRDLKKNMPNMEVFLESAEEILSLCADEDTVAVLRFDIRHFKQVNDLYGFDVGDKVILACYEIIKDGFAPAQPGCCFGRAHGDEFVVFAKADEAEMARIANSIASRMEQYDFPSIGCPEQMGCRIGILHAPKGGIKDIRQLIEETMDTVSEARKGGKYAVLVQALG